MKSPAPKDLHTIKIATERAFMEDHGVTRSQARLALQRAATTKKPPNEQPKNQQPQNAAPRAPFAVQETVMRRVGAFPAPGAAAQQAQPRTAGALETVMFANGVIGTSDVTRTETVEL